MANATQPQARQQRVPTDIIQFVEDRQKPRETFGQALRRLLFEERRDDATRQAGRKAS